MGLLTDILIASKDDCAAVLERYPAENAWPRLELKRLDNIKLAALLEAFDAPTEAKALEGEECLVAFREDGPWVFLLPAVLRDRLANLGKEDIRAVAERWAKHEELTFDDWSAEDVEVLLPMLRDHAEKAGASDLQLVLWMSQ